MKANELRIGNKITYNGTYAQLRKVNEFDEELARYLFDVKDEWDLIEPIPLTEEWLLKFGFETESFIATGDSCYISKLDMTPKPNPYRKYFKIDSYDGKKWEFMQGKFPTPIYIKSVHELQNLYFALSGNELQINI